MRRAIEGFSSWSSSLSGRSAISPAASRAIAASPDDRHTPAVPWAMIVVARSRQNHGSTGAFTPRAQ
jgi:hypothetical protein